MSESIHEPSPGEAQLTVRAIVTGCVLGGLVAVMNTYLGLRTGWGAGGSLVAALLGFAFWRLIATARPRRGLTVLETNITQTTGSAAGAMTGAAGLVTAIPALGIMGVRLSYLELTLWALAVAYLGVFFAVPLRHQMVEVEKLRFPSGTATAELIVSFFAQGARAIAQARWLLVAAIAAAIFTIVAFFVPQVAQPPMQWIGLGLLAAWSFSIMISPVMTGIGMLAGPRVGWSLLGGSLVGWAVLAPLVASAGWVEGPTMSYQTGARGWILWPGVAVMVADGLTMLALRWRSVLSAVRIPVADAGAGTAADRIPPAWWLGGLAAGTLATVVIGAAVFGIPPLLSILAVALSAFLSVVAVRTAGETDINPVGGVAKVTQLIFGGLARGPVAEQLMTTNLMGAAITGSGASQAADMMQDLKTGKMLGASPRKQFLAQCWGIAAGIVVSVGAYKIFERAGELDATFAIGGERVPAPAAQSWRAVAEVLSKGFGELPQHAVWAIIAGLLVGALLPVLRRAVPRAAPYLPSGVAFGIAFVLPAFYSIAMFIGAMILVAWRRASPASAGAYAMVVASGLMVGEGLMGVGTAILTLLGVGH